jgi:hypothetical protein
MPIKSSGQLSFTEIVAEFADTAPHSMSEFYRGGVKVPTVNTNIPISGAISFSNFYSAVNKPTLSVVYSTNTQQATVNPTSLPGYIAGLTDITITVNSGVYVWSDSTSIPALTINGGLSAGDTIRLINNGFIMGKGGNGGNGAGPVSGSTSGGPAISIGLNLQIINNSYIGGGGGGGSTTIGPGGGGGAGGGNGGRGQIYASWPEAPLAGGLGGTVGNAGSAGTGREGFNVTVSGGGGGGAGGGSGSNIFDFYFIGGGGGGGGGRIFPGVGGGAGAASTYGSPGNSGGSAGNPGTTAPRNAYFLAGGGGGWGASGGAGTDGSVNNSPGGSPGGRAIQLNGFTATRSGSGTTYGAVS